MRIGHGEKIQYLPENIEKKMFKMHRKWWIEKNGCDVSLSGKKCKHCEQMSEFDYWDQEDSLRNIYKLK